MKLPHWPDPKRHRNIKFGLSNMYKLLERLGNPHKLLPKVIHVAGSNGKGSNIAFLNSILTEANHKVHQYTSPSLTKFTERIILNGKEINDKYLSEILEECKIASEIKPKIEVTFFEGVTIAAFLAFSRIKSDILLLEVGMGGRLDATNVIDNPIVTIITPISNDHQEFLGNSLEKITMEKAGIIKEGVPVIIGNQKKEALIILKDEARKKNAKCYILGHEWKIPYNAEKFIMDINGHHVDFPFPSLLGRHQLENASTAIAALLSQDDLYFTDDDIGNGISNTEWPARLEKISEGKFIDQVSDNYEIYLDGGHNEAGAKAIANWIYSSNMEFAKKKKKIPSTYIICAMLNNKNIYRFLKYLSGGTNFVIGMSIKDDKNSKTAEKIAKNAMKLGIKAVDASNFVEAFEYIKTIHNNKKEENNNIINRIFRNKDKHMARIIICGSLYFAGQFIEENIIK